MEANENFPFGGCECRGGGCQCDEKVGPAAWSVVRDGKTMKVCTRCDFSEDKPTRKFLGDLNTNMAPFWEYDVLGAFCIMGDAAEAREKAESDPETAGTRVFAAAVGLVVK